MSWVQSSKGHIPEHAFIAGYENGQPLYIARGNHEGGVHPGKVASHLHALHIGYAGEEVLIEEYEVLVANPQQICNLHWEKITHGKKLPEDLLQVGHEQGKPLWVARAKINGGVHIGKAGRHLEEGCSISYAGKEYNPDTYEVLVYRDQLGEGIQSQ